jgi:hypothetical protein
MLAPTGSAQHRKQFGSDDDFDAARGPWLPPDQPGSFESEHHLVDRGRTDAKVSLQIGFGGRWAEDARIGVVESQILTLLWCESWGGRWRRHRCVVYADEMRRYKAARRLRGIATSGRT